MYRNRAASSRSSMRARSAADRPVGTASGSGGSGSVGSGSSRPVQPPPAPFCSAFSFSAFSFSCRRLFFCLFRHCFLLSLGAAAPEPPAPPAGCTFLRGGSAVTRGGSSASFPALPPPSRGCGSSGAASAAVRSLSVLTRFPGRFRASSPSRPGPGPGPAACSRRNVATRRCRRFRCIAALTCGTGATSVPQPGLGPVRSPSPYRRLRTFGISTKLRHGPRQRQPVRALVPLLHLEHRHGGDGTERNRHGPNPAPGPHVHRRPEQPRAHEAAPRAERRVNGSDRHRPEPLGPSPRFLPPVLPALVPRPSPLRSRTAPCRSRRFLRRAGPAGGAACGRGGATHSPAQPPPCAAGAAPAAMDDIFTQCREGNAVAVRLWLDNTENDLNQGDDHGFSPLHWACREGRSNVVDMLIMRGARINVMNRGDDTPLHLAASHGHRDIVQKLIQFKADINAVNEHGNTPLHYACFWGHDTVAEDLVGNGALVSIANKYSETPIDKAKMPLREILKEHAEKLGQNLTKIPYKDTFWKGTTRTRPRNGTLNKLAGIDYKQLSLSQKLNENQSGELWKGRWQGNDIVVKLLKIRDWTTRKSRDFNEEYPKLRIFSHPNVLPVLGACQAPPAPHPIVISHWMPYGSLYNVLHEGTNFVVDQMQAVKFAFDIARGMAFLHTLEPLIPRHHLNSRSIMIDEDMTARISMADVKFSFQCPGRMYAPAWVAPEALQKKPEEINRRSADMWSFAVLLWELVTREVPFADLSNMEIGMKVALEGLRPTIPPGISPHICKLMKICMNEDPAKRPKFDMIVPILEKMQDK
uniref:Scaffold protein ILK n=1 Tax=Coturnix japonica TaxID=93934 RepID=A0A8C2Y794_COTJA